MPVEQFVTVLRARWKLALTITLLVFGSVVAVSLLLPRQYTATAALLLDFKSPDPVGGVNQGQPLLASLMANEANVLQSERVMLRALKDLGLLDSDEWRRKWAEDTHSQGEFPEWMATRFGKELDVKLARDGSMLSVLYTAPNREFSASMANAIVKAYVDTTLALRVDPARKYNEFFDERAKSAREALEAAQRRLSTFQQGTGLIGSDGKLELDNARLAELSSQLVALQSVAAESSSREREAGRQVETLPEVIGSPLLAELNASLASQRTALLELESRLGERHPQVIQARAAIDQLSARIKSENTRVVRGLGVNSDVNKSRVAQVSAAIDAERARLLKVKGLRDDAAVLQRDVESAQRAYDSVLGRLNQSELESQLKQTNVSSLKKAAVPSSSSSPKLLVNAIVSLVLGLLIAAGAVALREHWDRRVRTVRDVVDVLKLPLLGTLPDCDEADPNGMRQRLLALGQ